MIDEHRQDLAAEYAVDALDPESARAFEAMLATDPELKALADDLREAAAMLAYDAPRHLPPPELRERVLAGIRAEAEASVPAPALASPVAAPRSGGSNLLPWALAAGFAVTTASLWMERDALQKEATDLKREAFELRNGNALAKVQIATLSSKLDEYAKTSAVIVWDPAKQQGVLKLANLPRPAAGKDYQLWVIDSKYPQPVDGGVVPVNDSGIAQVSFTPKQPIRKANKFAISVEPMGGVPEPTGTIVFLGD